MSGLLQSLWRCTSSKVAGGKSAALPEIGPSLVLAITNRNYL